MLSTLLWAGIGLSAAQERTPPEFRADVRLIRLDVSVVDGSGRAVAGLGPEHFRVFVGYVPPRPSDGRFHEVEVEVTVDGLRARTKKGYRAAPRLREP